MQNVIKIVRAFYNDLSIEELYIYDPEKDHNR